MSIINQIGKAMSKFLDDIENAIKTIHLSHGVDNRTLKIVPSFSFDTTLMVPSWAKTISFVINNPKPKLEVTPSAWVPLLSPRVYYQKSLKEIGLNLKMMSCDYIQNGLETWLLWKLVIILI